MTERSAEYELTAVVNHSGSVNFGHYTAEVKDAGSGNWCDQFSNKANFMRVCIRYLMNDDVVRQISRPSGSSENAYILALRQVETP